MFKRIFWVLGLIILLVACSDDESPIRPTPDSSLQEEIDNAPLTILSYMVANNNLDDDLYLNIATMCQGLSLMKKPATLLLYWDGKTTLGDNGATHCLLRFETDGKGNVNGKPSLYESEDLTEIISVAEIIKEYPTQVSTTEKVMTDVLNDMIGYVETERVGLIFSSHGSAWLKSIFTSRAFGQDGSNTDNSIIIPHMVSALKSTNKKFDFILFDACWMGTAEVFYDFKDVANYQISSVLEVPAYGFPYNSSVIPNLYEGTVSSYTKVCQEYINYYQELYETTSEQAWGTVALIDSKEMDGLVSILKEEIVLYKETLADFDVSSIQEYGRNGTGVNLARDLKQFIKILNNENVPSNFESQLNKTVLYKGCLEKARPSSYSVDAENFCGIGIYIPVKSRSKWNEYFKTIDWYTASGWNEVTFTWDF